MSWESQGEAQQREKAEARIGEPLPPRGEFQNVRIAEILERFERDPAEQQDSEEDDLPRA